MINVMEPVIREKDGHHIVGLSTLRLFRLLRLAHYGGNHKRFYSQYCFLRDLGYVDWVMGHAFLTENGKRRLEVEEEMLDKD